MNGVTKTAKASDKLLNNCAESIIETNQAGIQQLAGIFWVKNLFYNSKKTT